MSKYDNTNLVPRLKCMINCARNNEYNERWYVRLFHLKKKPNEYGMNWTSAANYITRAVRNYHNSKHKDGDIFPLNITFSLSTWKENLYNKNDVRIAKDYCIFVEHLIKQEFRFSKIIH